MSGESCTADRFSEFLLSAGVLVETPLKKLRETTGVFLRGYSVFAEYQMIIFFL